MDQKFSSELYKNFSFLTIRCLTLLLMIVIIISSIRFGILSLEVVLELVEILMFSWIRNELGEKEIRFREVSRKWWG